MIKKYIGLIFLLTGYFSYAQTNDIDVSATVYPEIVQLDQPLTYEIVIRMKDSIDVSDPRLPSIEGLQFISRSQSSQFSASIINGKSETIRSRTFIYEFKAVQVGEFEIPPADIYVGNTPYKTNSVKIKIQTEPLPHTQRKTRRQKSRSLFDNEDDSFLTVF